MQHQVLKKFYKKHGKFKHIFLFQSFELIALFSGKLGRKEKDLQLDNGAFSQKEKGNVANSELGSETCDNHKWCDAGLGDLIVIVKSNGFPVQNMQLLNSTNTSLHLHSLCRVFKFQK